MKNDDRILRRPDEKVDDYRSARAAWLADTYVIMAKGSVEAAERIR